MYEDFTYEFRRRVVIKMIEDLVWTYVELTYSLIDIRIEFGSSISCSFIPARKFIQISTCTSQTFSRLKMV